MTLFSHLYDVTKTPLGGERGAYIIYPLIKMLARDNEKMNGFTSLFYEEISISFMALRFNYAPRDSSYFLRKTL